MGPPSGPTFCDPVRTPLPILASCSSIFGRPLLANGVFRAGRKGGGEGGGYEGPSTLLLTWPSPGQCNQVWSPSQRSCPFVCATAVSISAAIVAISPQTAWVFGQWQASNPCRSSGQHSQWHCGEQVPLSSSAPPPKHKTDAPSNNWMRF